MLSYVALKGYARTCSFIIYLDKIGTRNGRYGNSAGTKFLAKTCENLFSDLLSFFLLAFLFHPSVIYLFIY
jgi:hypothetical protein